MQLNLPFLHRLSGSRSILIAGAGGGQDVLAGLPIYFTLRDLGYTVHLANFSFCDFPLLKIIGDPVELVPDQVVGARGALRMPFNYYPEGYLSQWFLEACGEDVTVWMFAKSGAALLREGYRALIAHLNVDALILVDGGVDSIMRGDEESPGTLLEDSITLAAVSQVDLPVKLLACLGFGTEVEELLCHHHALENIAALTKIGGFLGTCSLLPQMPAFQKFEAACRYIWEQPKGHAKSHITTRVIPAARGEFGNYHMYGDDLNVSVFISPLMSLYWCFDAETVSARSLLVPHILDSDSLRDCLVVLREIRHRGLRRERRIPYQ